MGLARILATGVVAGSARVVVSLPDGLDNTQMLVHWGDQLLGSAPLSGGLAQVTLRRPLAADDILTASVTTQGNQSGPPIRAAAQGVIFGPWVSATEFVLIDPAGNPQSWPVAQFKREFGYLPASLENTAGLTTVNYPEFTNPPSTAILFDMALERQGGQTTVSVTNVQNQRGGVLTKFPGDSGWGNTLNKVFTVGGTYSVLVKGTQNTDAEAVTRSVTVTIQTPAPAAPAPDPAIKYYFWRNFSGNGNNLIALYVNCDQLLQARCSPSLTADNWKEGVAYDNFNEKQIFFENVPAGPVQIQIRLAGEANSAKWVTMQFTKPF